MCGLTGLSYRICLTGLSYRIVDRVYKFGTKPHTNSTSAHEGERDREIYVLRPMCVRPMQAGLFKIKQVQCVLTFRQNYNQARPPFTHIALWKSLIRN